MKSSAFLVGICICIQLNLFRAHANHVHMQVAWRNDTLILEIFDFAAGSFPSDTFPFVINNAGIYQVPSTPAFSFLGESGATFFALPQDDNPQLPFLGIGVDAIPRGTFTRNRIHLKLVSANGPGRFALYQVSSFGLPTIEMNTADGIDASDSIVLPTAAHVHVNWAFSSPGDYRLTFIGEAIEQSTGDLVTSTPATFRFRVLPPPEAKLGLEFGSAQNDLSLRIKSRAGARLQLLEADNLGQWNVRAVRLLTEPEWEFSPESSDSPHRFWQIQEIFE